MRALARLVLATSLFLTLGVPLVAAAQSEPAAREVIFERGEAVGGTPASSPIEILSVPRPLGRTSLIKIRTQFVDEIVESARAL